MHLTLMTYNIRHGAGDAGGVRIDLEPSAAVISAHEPDIVGLNELYGAGLVKGFASQAQQLAQKAGFPHHVFGKSSSKGLFPYGNGLLSRFPILDARSIPLECSAGSRRRGYHESRSVLRVQLDLGLHADALEVEGAPILTVFVTHLGLGEGERRESVEQIAHLVDRERGRCVLLGDLNVTPQDPVLAPLKARLLDVCEAAGVEAATYPASSPRSRIDYIMVGPGIEVLSAEVYPQIASDHLACGAVVRL